jgi:hypothetical protein
MLFPSITNETKRNAGGLDFSDRKNAHSMTPAVRVAVGLFRSVKREAEIQREILGFSVFYDNRNVRIHGQCPVVYGSFTSYHRHLISSHRLMADGGKRSWNAYKFIINVYTL